MSTTPYQMLAAAAMAAAFPSSAQPPEIDSFSLSCKGKGGEMSLSVGKNGTTLRTIDGENKLMDSHGIEMPKLFLDRHSAEILATKQCAQGGVVGDITHGGIDEAVKIAGTTRVLEVIQAAEKPGDPLTSVRNANNISFGPR